MILFPKTKVIIFGIIFNIISLIYLISVNFKSKISYILYLIMSYFLLVLVIKLYQVFSKKIKNNKVVNKVLNNNKISIYINIVYALFKLILGIYYKSIWFITFSVYYALLIGLRINVLNNTYESYRRTGILLLLMNVILIVIILVIVNDDLIIKYSAVVSISIAAYTFFTIINSIVSFIKSRKNYNLISRQSKLINLIISLISLLSLEVVLISSFGNTTDIIFKEIIILITGGGLCTTLITISLYMIIKGTEKLKS